MGGNVHLVRLRLNNHHVYISAKLFSEGFSAILQIITILHRAGTLEPATKTHK